MLLALSVAERADLALWVAIGSAAFTLGALVWEVVRHRLVGPRVAVRLVPGIVTETGHLVRRAPGRHNKPSLDIADLVGGRPWIEVAIVTVTNHGRTPISVSEVALDFGAQPRWRFWWRHTVSGFPVEIYEGEGEASTYRLEPGSSVTVIYDLWLLVNEGRTDRTKTVRVRGSVLPAGRRLRRKRSPRRLQWKITSKQQAIWEDGPTPPELEVFRSVWRAVAFRQPDRVYHAWVSIGALMTDYEHGEPPDFLNPDAEPPSLQQIAEVLQPPLEGWHALMEAGRIRVAIMGSMKQ